MNQWNNEELHKRQKDGDVGFLNIDPRAGGRGWTGRLLPPAVVFVVGLILVYVGPVPGLGVFMVLGGVMAVLITVLVGWLGG